MVLWKIENNKNHEDDENNNDIQCAGPNLHDLKKNDS